MDDADYGISERTLQRYATKLNEGQAPLSNFKSSGNVKALSGSQTKILVGYVLDKVMKNEQVVGKTIRVFCKTEFGVDISKATVTRYMAELGFVKRKAKLKAKGYIVDVDSLVDLYLMWLQEARTTKFFSCDLELLCSIDFTFTSHRTRQESSYVPKGGYI